MLSLYLREGAPRILQRQRKSASPFACISQPKKRKCQTKEALSNKARQRQFSSCEEHDIFIQIVARLS